MLIKLLTQVVNLYKYFGFHIHTCYTDGEFSHLQNQVEGVHMDTPGNNEHVGDIERVIRIIKERVRCSIQNTHPNIYLQLIPINGPFM